MPVTPLVEAASVPAKLACEIIDLLRCYYARRKVDDPEDRIIEALLRDCVARRSRRSFDKRLTRTRCMGYGWNKKRVYRP